MQLDIYVRHCYRAFIQKHGDHPWFEHPYHPDPKTFSKDDSIRCYVNHPLEDKLVFGHWISATGFVVVDTFCLKEITRYYESNKIDTSVFDKESLDRAKDQMWAYFKDTFIERFQENSELIYEGVIDRRVYFDDNSLEERSLIDEMTGELIYQAKYIKGQFYDEENNRPVSYLKSYYKYKDGKELYADRVKNKKGRTEWIIKFPRHLAGTSLESIYLKNFVYARSTKRVTQ